MTENTCPACGEPMTEGPLTHYRRCQSDGHLQTKIMDYLGIPWDKHWVWYITDPQVIKAWQAASEEVRQRWLVQQALAGELRGRV